MFFILVKVRYANLMKRNKALEREVSQRTLHLQNANHLKEKILMMVGHDLQSPLHFLGYLSETNYDALMSRQHKKAGLISQEMKNTTKKIYAFVDEFNLWARVQDEQFNLKKTTFSLTSLVGELELFFKEILQLQHNTFEFTTEEEYELNTNKELLKAVLRNLIDNAQKHTHNGTISIHCSRDNDKGCLIRVSDTGKGMSPEILKNINNLIKRAETITDFESGNRLGYQFIIDFATRLNAHLTLESEEGKGTTILISGVSLHQVGHKIKKDYRTP
jgi:signal transduction histidine kinase